MYNQYSIKLLSSFRKMATIVMRKWRICLQNFQENKNLSLDDTEPATEHTGAIPTLPKALTQQLDPQDAREWFPET